MTEPALSLRGVRWSCMGRPVLQGVDFEVKPGECVALCGENGAGKTTLLRMITGLMTPDAGTLTHQGGIGLVHQHFSLVPALSVAENVVLGAEPMRHGLFDREAASALTQTLAQKAGIEIDPEARVESLSVGMRQRVELLKALRTAKKILLLDEPTAVLGPRDIDGFLSLVSTLKHSGLAVVFVSHKLHEIARIADRALVLYRGKITYAAAPTPSTLQAIADAMIGRTGAAMESALEQSLAPTGKVIALLQELAAGSGRDRIEGVNLRLYSHRITGIAGVEGNGQHGLFRVLCGALRPETGAYQLEGSAVSSCAHAREKGVRLIPADRHSDAMLPAHDLLDHLRLGSSAEPPDTKRLLERFDVRPADPGFSADALSGGNQQKLIFARELGAASTPATPARLLVVHEPTRGVDFLAKQLLWGEIRGARDAGATVVVISSDLDELRALCDEVVVLFRGKAILHMDAKEASDERLSAAMAGL